MFELLGAASLPEISLPAAANLLGLTERGAVSTFEVLERASLIEQHVPGRWRMHDLIQLYAAQQARKIQPTIHQEVALDRLVYFYLHSAHSADRVINPRRPPIEISSPGSSCRPLSFSDPVKARDWFGSELACLRSVQVLAVESGRCHRAAWQLTWAMDTYQYRQGYLHERIAAWRSALAAAQTEGDAVALIMVHRLFGHAYTRVGKHTKATTHLRQALNLAEEIADDFGQAQVHYTLTKAWEEKGETRRALEHAMSALRIFQNLNDATWEANALSMVGLYSARLGNHQEARTFCQKSLSLCRHNNERQGEAQALSNLGYVGELAAQPNEALSYYRQALDLFRILGHVYYEANSLDCLGRVSFSINDLGQARAAWEGALLIYQDQGRQADCDRIKRKLRELG
ncbi:tetratricopeptide repeat protein [Streptomyces sp. NBC_00414]|uniref:tetratricopeptide repeat protein n=1 Tax=Streptomyces sp. NBC_00414 TaxID=2975739 RepID=UPI002E1E9F72